MVCEPHWSEIVDRWQKIDSVLGQDFPWGISRNTPGLCVEAKIVITHFPDPYRLSLAMSGNFKNNIKPGGHNCFVIKLMCWGDETQTGITFASKKASYTIQNQHRLQLKRQQLWFIARTKGVDTLITVRKRKTRFKSANKAMVVRSAASLLSRKMGLLENAFVDY